MLSIRYVQEEDQSFWFSLDPHLSKEEFLWKVAQKRGYVLLDDQMPVGLLRYHLFWDQIPFCTLLYIEQAKQKRGYGRMLMAFWEQEMKERGHQMVMTSTRTDEEAQHFYRKLGYQEAGGLILTVSAYAQPMELFFVKAL
ncbi:MAG: GNAT family N-acetyltransferase [Clostridiales bacterium]|nr:GNAT family N-acetyltransferase [Clostridiales bacterium]